MTNNISVERMSYDNTKHVRILKACLEKWFKEPKDLNLTSPSLSYPFNFNKWVNYAYTNADTVTYVLKKDKWIIGHISLKIRMEKQLVHIFHVFVDKSQRGKGYSKLLIKQGIDWAKNKKFSSITLGVSPKNQIAINLYKSLGFSVTGFNKSGSLKMKLELI